MTIKLSAKPHIKNVAARMGFEIRRVADDSCTPKMPRNGLAAQKVLLDRMNVDQPIIFDVGARYGGTSAEYRRLIPNAKIYAFEPFADSFERARSRHIDDPDVILTQAAVSDSAGTREFFINGDIEQATDHDRAIVDGTHSLLPRPSEGKRYYPESAELSESVHVDVITLDEFTEQQAIDRIQLAKFDIQGGELMAFLGAQRLLEEQRIDLIYSEVSLVAHYEGGPLFDEIWSHLRGYGYSLFSMYDIFYADDGQIRQADALFVREQVRSSVIDRE